jgi:hypothetical protein
MTLSYVFDGTKVFSYDRDPSAEDVADYLGCDEEVAEAILCGEEIEDWPTKDDLLGGEYDFANYMQDRYRWDAYQKWEGSQS